MEGANYYFTTLMNAFKNIIPLLAFLLGGYFVFIKLPFLFLKKSMKEQKEQLDHDLKKLNEQKRSSEEKKSKTESNHKQQQRPPRPKPREKTLTPEEIFGFTPHASINPEELRKRYHELIKKNHPDRVASMGEDFKKLAENNTKEINEAYHKLKKKAA